MHIQLASLGISSGAVMSGFRFIRFDKIHLFSGLVNKDVERSALDVQSKLENDFGVSVQIHDVDVFDLLDCIINVIQVVKSERKKYFAEYPDLKFYINMTGGTNILSSAMLLSGYIVNCDVFYIKSERGVNPNAPPESEKLIMVPMPRLTVNDLRETQRSILYALGEFDGPVSLTILKNKIESINTVQGISRHIPFFEEYNLINCKFKGKEKLVHLTDTGRLLFSLMG